MTIRAAWREAAKSAHPDAGGSNSAMSNLNAALEQAISSLAQPVTKTSSSHPHGSSSDASVDPDEPKFAGPISRDAPSFSVSVLPVETYEALLIIANWWGDVLLDEPPYAMEVYVRQEVPYWLHLDLVPEAGSTMVSIMLGSVDGRQVPRVENVRDELIDALNSLEWT
jgi:hypothetical protein